MTGGSESDEVWRRRIARLGYTPEQWQDMVDNIPEAPADAPLPDPHKPGLISFRTDGSVWTNDEHGVAHQTQPPDAERPDAEVHALADRRRDEAPYESWHATVEGAIRYDVGGTPAPIPGSWEALVRLTHGPRPIVMLDDFDLEHLDSVILIAVERGAAGELSLEEAAHAALDGLRRAGVPVPPREGG